MKKILFIIALIVACAQSSWAQDIFIGERIPDLKGVSWLGGEVEPEPTHRTLVNFFASNNEQCCDYIDKLKQLSDESKGRFSVFVIVKGNDRRAIDMLSEYVGPHFKVGIDTSSKIMAEFGVSYLPYGVLIDSKNRAIWMGNALQMPIQELK